MAGVKTVVRVRLRAPELTMAAAKRGLTSFSGELKGNFVRKDQVAETRFAIRSRARSRSATTFTYAFLRALPPGAYTLQLALTAPGGRVVGEASIELSIPEVGTTFSAGPRPRGDGDAAVGRGDRHRRRGRRRDSRSVGLEAQDPAARIARLPSACCDSTRRSSRPSPKSSSGWKTSSWSAARSRRTPSRSISARSRGARRSGPSDTTRTARSSTRTPGRSTRAARGWP